MKKTIIDLFEASVDKYGGKTFLLEKRHHKFEPTTYAETRELALEVGAGLVSVGIRPGDKVAILAEGSNAWIISELGLFYAGAVSVPLSVKLEESNDLLFRLRHAEVKAIFVSKYQLPKIRRIRAELPQIEHVIVLGHIPLETGETAYGTLRRLGRDYLSKHKEEFLKIGQAIQNDDYATITYTSGTTADPKGVVLTHRNYTANVEQSLSRIDIPSYYRTLIILPLDHCFAHVVGFYIMIACGASVATVQIGKTPMETLKNIPLNIREVQPHFLLSVPALAKNFRKNIENSIRTKGAFTEKFFRLALKVGYAYNADGYSRGKGWRCLLLWQLASMAVGLPLLLPSPLAVLLRLGQLCTGADFWLTVASSLLRILLGFLLGVLFGTALAGLCWRFRLIDALARPLLGMLKSTPVASFIILALVWVKTTWLATVISFIMVLPLIYANVREGIDSADRQLLEMAQVFRLSRRKTFRYCYLPAILPFFLSAVSSALGFAWKSGIAAEVLGRPARAIGSQIYDSKIYLETPDLFAWTLVVILLSVLLERLAVRFVRWAGKRSMRVRL